MGHPQPPWATCSNASPPSVCKTAKQSNETPLIAQHCFLQQLTWSGHFRQLSCLQMSMTNLHWASIAALVLMDVYCLAHAPTRMEKYWWIKFFWNSGAPGLCWWLQEGHFMLLYSVKKIQTFKEDGIPKLIARALERITLRSTHGTWLPENTTIERCFVHSASKQASEIHTKSGSSHGMSYQFSVHNTMFEQYRSLSIDYYNYFVKESLLRNHRITRLERTHQII